MNIAERANRIYLCKVAPGKLPDLLGCFHVYACRSNNYYAKCCAHCSIDVQECESLYACLDAKKKYITCDKYTSMSILYLTEITLYEFSRHR